MPNAAPPTPAAQVVSVEVISAIEAVWTFDTDITGPPTDLADWPIADRPAAGFEEVLTRTVRVSYYGEALTPGLTWNLDPSPDGLAFAGGATLAAPFSGSTI